MPGARVILEKEIPGDPAFVTPLIVSAVDALLREKVIDAAAREKVQLCLSEALKNAVLHGCRGEFEKRVRLWAFAAEAAWGFLIEDDGEGFDPAKVPNPAEGDGLWGVSGRGLHIMKHCMDRVEHFAGGSALLLVRRT